MYVLFFVLYFDLRVLKCLDELRLVQGHQEFNVNVIVAGRGRVMREDQAHSATWSDPLLNLYYMP